MKWEVLSKKSSPDITNLLLANRGVKTAKGRKEFLDPRLPEKWSLAQLGISQIEIKKAKERIKKALRTKERVVIYGDYDADGICGTAIL